MAARQFTNQLALKEHLLATPLRVDVVNGVRETTWYLLE